jgi:aminopeptidase N
LNILRETILGRELFDHAFKEYSRRWMFKHPNPADFFRTMEDASGIDLDWFWRGWFYTTDPVDISIDKVVEGVFNTKNPEVENARIRAERSAKPEELTILRNRKDVAQTAVEANPDLNDFYNSYDPLAVTETDKKAYQAYLSSLSPDDKKWLDGQKYFYQLDFSNVGGLVMPVIVEFNYEDGTKEVERIPAEIWRIDNKKASKIFVKDKRVKSFTLDPYSETADIDVNNNYFPRQQVPTRFELLKQSPYMRGQSSAPNPMQLQKKEKEGKTGGGGN